MDIDKLLIRYTGLTEKGNILLINTIINIKINFKFLEKLCNNYFNPKESQKFILSAV